MPPFSKSASASTVVGILALCPSRGEARRLVQQGGIVVDEKKVESIDESIPQEKLAGDGIIIRKGKKVFHKAVTK